MRVLLVGPDLEGNLSLQYLASSLREAGHRPRIATFDTAQDTASVRQAAKDAELIGLSMCFQVRAPEFIALAAGLKADAPGTMVVVGGHYASCAAVELLENHPELDVVAVHEGEQTIVELAGLAERTPASLREVAGIVFRDGDEITRTPARRILEDLDELPWPDRSGPSRLVAGVPTAYMMGSRGCVSSCDYCCITTLHRLVPGRRFRQREPEKVVDEMAWMYHERGARQFIFHDDNFLLPSATKNLERVGAFDRAMRARGLRHVGLVLKCRPQDVHEEVLRRLREMGLLRIFLGIESGSAAGLDSIGRRQTVEDEHRALRICEDLGISTQYTMIIVHPEATPRTMLDDLAFVREHAAHPLSFCRAEIYAGTPLEKKMIDAGRARGSYLAREYTYSDPATACAWDVAKDVLRERCWSQKNLQGQVIQLDHLMAVFGHFYDGREVDALVRDFLDVELAVNLDTVELFEELIEVCAEIPDARSAELARRVASLRERERASRDPLQARVCDLRDELKRLTRAMVGLPVPTPAPAAPPRAPVRPRHAAAVVLAIGLLGCGGDGREDGGVIEAPPPPMDSGFDGAFVVDDGGVIEAPPPPMDAGEDAGFVDDGGVIEAPPPPMDSGFVDDGGVIEAPPPPMDSGFVDDGGVIEAPPPAMEAK